MKNLEDRKVFRRLVTIEDANAELRRYFDPKPVSIEEIPISEALGRTLANDMIAPIDVPGFDRAAMDGYAVIAEDTFGAENDNPCNLRVIGRCEAGQQLSISLKKNEAVEISTGAPIPRGASAVVMVEHTRQADQALEVFRPVVPGENIGAAGSDMMEGELILRKGETITPREVGVLAALGTQKVRVYTKPRVSVLSTGNEIVAPGSPTGYGRIYDINASAIAASVIECGGVPIDIGISPDDLQIMEKKLRQSLQEGDIALTSGSTSAGAGDLVYRIIDKLGKPGVLIHGISVKPGKPALIAVVNGKPLIGLPGYPTSALTIFHALVAPIIREMSGLARKPAIAIDAKLAVKTMSAKGRRELLPVHLTQTTEGKYLAYPTTTGSGAITTFSLSDGFIDISDTVEFLDEGEQVKVKLFGATLTPADLVVIGSHCIGIDVLLTVIRERCIGYLAKVINTGSLGGLHAIKRGEADIAGIHMLDEATNEYNLSYYHRFGLEGKAVLVRGYSREQGLILPKGNPKRIGSLEDVLGKGLSFMNRNRGSGTRILVDLYLSRIANSKRTNIEELTREIRGYNMEAKSHSAVAAAVAHGRADIGVGIRTVAESYELDFVKIGDESFDFLVAKDRLDKNAVRLFVDTLRSREFADSLSRKAPGLRTLPETGNVVAQ